ncbi:MAG TPA: type I restriction enzyme HsdR N-terminal domain-containing protein [Syntrophorhabdus sp.]|nr:type I restriction enzyme HsdR N-terminal domain-containing protein [Syntrophorhabdus sp.]
MALNLDAEAVAAALRADVDLAPSGAKRLKLRTLLAKFGYTKRTDSNTGEITRLLSEVGLSLNPPIIRFGVTWEITQDDWIILSNDVPNVPLPDSLPSTWNADGWFDRIVNLELRTEKEVEIKFIVPLLARLGYGDDDRYDGMPVPAAYGSRPTTLVIDFALFNSTESSLRNQPLLTVEAKREGRLVKQRELESAHNQAKSYCLWAQCDYFMITDSRTIQAFHIARGQLGELAPLFVCERNDLTNKFGELYALVSKKTLTQYYLAKFASADEALS